MSTHIQLLSAIRPSDIPAEYADLVASSDADVDDAADTMEEVTGVDPSADPRI